MTVNSIAARGHARGFAGGGRISAAAVLAFSLAACHRGPGEPPTATVRVQNNLVPAVALTISVVPASGERRTVGVVRASQTEELRLPIGSSADPHRLLAKAGSGPATASRQFTLSTASVIDWNVGQNVLNVTVRR